MICKTKVTTQFNRRPPRLQSSETEHFRMEIHNMNAQFAHHYRGLCAKKTQRRFYEWNGKLLRNEFITSFRRKPLFSIVIFTEQKTLLEMCTCFNYINYATVVRIWYQTKWKSTEEIEKQQKNATHNQHETLIKIRSHFPNSSQRSHT